MNFSEDPDPGMDDYSIFFLQNKMNDPLDYALDQFNFQSFLSENQNPQRSNNHSNSNIKALRAGTEKPVKQLDISGWNYSTSGHMTPKVSPSSSLQLISFRNSNSPQAISRQVNNGLKEAMNPKNEERSPGNIKLVPLISPGSKEGQFYPPKHVLETNRVSQGSNEGQFCPPKHVQETNRVGLMPRTCLHAPDHIIAERNRREKIRQEFIALSALVPGRKKMDKASVLEDAFNYLKQLQEQVRMLEEQAAKHRTESMVVVKKSRLCTDDETSPSYVNFGSQNLPEIEARVSDRDVLIRIQCEKKKECVVNILTEIEKLRLTVLNSKVLPFGSSTLDITVVAQMDAELATTAKDLARNLRSALLQFM